MLHEAWVSQGAKNTVVVIRSTIRKVIKETGDLGVIDLGPEEGGGRGGGE